VQPLRGRRLPAALAVLALASSLAVGNGSGGSTGCSAGVSVEVPAASTPGQPVRVATGAAVVCPSPQSPPGGLFGPTKQPQPVNHPPGTACTQEIWEPMELQLTPGGQEYVFWPDPTFNGNGSNTPEPQAVARVISGIDPKTFFIQGGTIDFFYPFTLHGKWDATNTCVPLDKADQQASYTSNCPGATIAYACLIQQTHTIAGVPPTLADLNGRLVDLRARMLQLIHPGQITSVPAQPHPGLVNTQTCFSIQGASIDGQDPTQPATFELVLLGPADATGRQVYYVFRIDVTLVTSLLKWTFGDNDPTTETPSQCPGAGNPPLWIAHRYLHYSPPGGFAVALTETFNLHVTEYWYDSAGTPHPPMDLGDFQPAITVQPGPAGGFTKAIVQEEGVPIG
jgi:hypothetical protein